MKQSNKVPASEIGNFPTMRWRRLFHCSNTARQAIGLRLAFCRPQARGDRPDVRDFAGAKTIDVGRAGCSLFWRPGRGERPNRL